MPQSELNILILKPTSRFISFIASQLPEIELPDLRCIQSDNTAYSLPKGYSDDAILAELEEIFPIMMQHEVSRLIGSKLASSVTGSFVDFLCCFKFDFHSHAVLMESSLDEAHQLIAIKPRSVVLKFMQQTNEDPIDLRFLLEKLDVSHTTEHATLLIKNFKKLTDIAPFIQDYYQPIVNAEMARMSDCSDEWPPVNSFNLFSKYFEVEVHSQLVHLH